MLLSHIKELLDETISIAEFRKETEIEIAAYKELYTKKNTTIAVYLKEDIYYLFTETHFGKLNVLFNTKKLDDHEVSYICDALTLSEMTMYENDELLNKIESLVITND
jgi:hypothetical protein